MEKNAATTKTKRMGASQLTDKTRPTGSGSARLCYWPAVHKEESAHICDA